MRSLKRFAKERAKDRTADFMKKAGEEFDFQVHSYVRRFKIKIPSLPLNFKRLSFLAEAYEERPAAIDFPRRMMAMQFAFFFLLIAASFTLSKGFLIVLALPIMAFAILYNTFTLKIAKSLTLSVVKTRIFTLALFIAGAAAGIFLRQLIFGKGW